jgi:hypothetical protein
MFSFQHHKVDNMLVTMLDPCYKGLGVIIKYVGKDGTFQSIGEFDR